jgi:hypothetical protein
MPVVEVLQWIGASRMTGILEVARGQVMRAIQFREGRIVACWTNDPSTLLGQFLLSKGLLDTETFRKAMATQERTGTDLPTILVEMQILTREEIDRQVAAKAQETIFGLFDWDAGCFEFSAGGERGPHAIHVDLAVEDVVLRGLQRLDEMHRIRSIFGDPAMILQRTDRAIPPALLAHPTASRLFGLVDGKRTFAQMVLEARTSAHAVGKFLLMMMQLELIETVPSASSDGEEASGPVERTSTGNTDEERQAQEIAAGLRLIERAEYEKALASLEQASRDHAGVRAFRDLLLKAEIGFLDQTRSGPLRRDRVPRKLPAADGLSGPALSPSESFLLDVVDGASDIKAIVWTAPLREAEVLRGLKGLLDRGIIEIVDPGPVQEPSGKPLRWL